jgi:hypothetical protein
MCIIKPLIHVIPMCKPSYSCLSCLIKNETSELPTSCHFSIIHGIENWAYLKNWLLMTQKTIFWFNTIQTSHSHLKNMLKKIEDTHKYKHYKHWLGKFEKSWLCTITKPSNQLLLFLLWCKPLIIMLDL